MEFTFAIGNRLLFHICVFKKEDDDLYDDDTIDLREEVDEWP